MDQNSSQAVPDGQLFMSDPEGSSVLPKKCPKKKSKAEPNRSRQRQAFPSRTVAEKELLIVAVERRSNIWKKESDEYHNRDSTLTTWQEISQEVNIPVEECKSLWRNLRDSFASKYRKVKDGKSGDGLDDVADGARARKWIFFDQLLFLADTLAFRATDSNFERISPKSGTDELKDSDVLGLRELPTGNKTGHLDPPSMSKALSSELGNRKSRKRNATDIMLENISKHMAVVGEVLAEPALPTSGRDRFVQYLSGILESVPPQSIRKCEQDIIAVANAYVDSKAIQIIQIEEI